jgi:hypothetical protein
VSDWVPVGPHTIGSVQIVGPGTSNWVGGVGSLQWTHDIGQDVNGNSYESATLFSPTLTCTSALPYQLAIPVTNIGFIRLKTTTAQTGAADKLTAIWRLS